VARGGVAFRGATANNYELTSPGTSGQVLTSNGTGADPTFQTPAAGYTDEQAQDAVGTILTDTATIDFTYTDATPTITADVINDSITFAKLQNIATDSLVGRDTAGTGDPENILLNATLSMDGSGNLQRAALTGDVTASAGSNSTTIANNAVSDAKLRDSAATSVIGRAANSSGDPADIAGSAQNQVLAYRSSALAFTAITALGYWDVLTNGDPASPELIFDGTGDTIAVWTAS
jgi:hypothetical protein